jgi:uncharacterized protein YndB with AHSA1/START domain
MNTTTETLVYERVLQIDAAPETVWEFLVDPEKVARWKGLPATMFEPRPGGAYRIEIVPGHIASGTFVELDRPRRLVYTWGWEPGADGPNPVPPGSSTVEIELAPVDGGTSLRFTHRDLPNTEAAASHGTGWDHYLSRLEIAATGGEPGPDPWHGSAAG